jgi:hypothetical protein
MIQPTILFVALVHKNFHTPDLHSAKVVQKKKDEKKPSRNIPL